MAKAAKAPGKKGGKKEKKNIPHGVANIHASFNNTIVTITDPKGNVLSWSSSGVQGFKGRVRERPSRPRWRPRPQETRRKSTVCVRSMSA